MIGVLRGRWAELTHRPASTWWTLVWLAALLYVPALSGGGALQYVVGGAVLVAYVAFHLHIDSHDGRLRRWAPAITALLAVAATPVNAGANILLVYAAASAGTTLPRRPALRWFAVLTVLVVGLALVSPIPLPWRLFTFGPSLVLVWTIGMITLSYAEQDREERFRAARVEHLATLTERERIARDLHDLLGHTLTGIVVRSQLAQRLTRADAEAGIAEMAEVERAARAALSEVRDAVSGWRRLTLDDELAVARGSLAVAGVELTVVRDPGLVLTPSAESALALALREAVTNVVRHARAGHCTIALRRVDDRVELEIADDGVGGDQRDGNGLTGMRERIAALGGEVRRLARGGTAVTVVVPAAVAT